jgi:hypothetical protein
MIPFQKLSTEPFYRVNQATVRAGAFRGRGEREIRLNGDVYVRTGLDDGPRYLLKKG